ncbi:hypothetical protein INR49_028836, partial [Caranx melampygus]
MWRVLGKSIKMQYTRLSTLASTRVQTVTGSKPPPAPASKSSEHGPSRPHEKWFHLQGNQTLGPQELLLFAFGRHRRWLYHFKLLVLA